MEFFLASQKKNRRGILDSKIEIQILGKMFCTPILLKVASCGTRFDENNGLCASHLLMKAPANLKCPSVMSQKRPYSSLVVASFQTGGRSNRASICILLTGI